MGNKVILSIKPEFVSEIQAGRKRFEYRKAIFKHPVEKVYIYASAPVSRVVGEFQPVDIIEGSPDEVWRLTKDYAGIEKQWFDSYFQDRTKAFAIEIKNLIVYKTPKPLPFHAPQSFRYIDQL